MGLFAQVLFGNFQVLEQTDLKKSSRINTKDGNTYIQTAPKSEIGVGTAATTGNRTGSASLTKFSSIFAAETNAIHLALNKISATKGKNFTIFTDSRNCLQALQNKFRPTQKYEN